MRLVLRGNQRQAAPDVHDPAESARPLDAGHRRADAAFPLIRDLVTDVSWNFRAKKSIKHSSRGRPTRPTAPGGMAQVDVERVQEFRKCIECFLCQDVCHVLREHQMFDQFVGPRHLVYAAALEMHPLDTADRVTRSEGQHGLGYCNITKCCTKVCPENITITDNAIIPLKERVVDQLYDPVAKMFRMLRSAG